jgi:hypothetical protein
MKPTFYSRHANQENMHMRRENASEQRRKHSQHVSSITRRPVHSLRVACCVRYTRQAPFLSRGISPSHLNGLTPLIDFARSLSLRGCQCCPLALGPRGGFVTQKNIISIVTLFSLVCPAHAVGVCASIRSSWRRRGQVGHVCRGRPHARDQGAQCRRRNIHGDP